GDVGVFTKGLKIDHPQQATLPHAFRRPGSGNVTAMRWELIISVAALLIALVAVVIGILVYRRLTPRAGRRAPEPGRAAPTGAEDHSGQTRTGPAAFIVNPTKLSLPSFRRRVESIAAELGVPAP